MLRMVYKIADCYDLTLMMLGTIAAAINGLSLPVLLTFQSRIYNNYGRSQASASAAKSSDASKQAILFVYAAIITSVAAYLQVSCWAATGTRQAQRLRLKYVYTVLKQDVSYLDCEKSSAEVIHDVSSNIMQVQESIGEQLGNFIFSMLRFIGGCLAGLVLIWRLVLVVLIFIPLLVVPGILYGKVVSSHSRKKQSAYAAAGTIAKQAISSIRVVYAFTAEKKTLELYSRSLDKVVKLEKAQGLAKGLVRGSTGIHWIVWAFIIWYGSKLVAQGHGNGAQVLCLGAAFVIGSTALGSAIEGMKALSEGQVALERILQVTERIPSIDIDDASHTQLTSLEGRMHLQHVTFSYPSRPGTLVLEDFNLEIPAGKITALVGRSGSGKSTIIALLERFYDPMTGQVLLDGADIRNLELKWYRNQIGLVSQEPTLFSTSIRENILLGKDNASMNEVIDAARKANAHDFIVALPDGYETQVGELGTQMSGGQKQRISIARAMIRNPCIMLLDEATSALDNESEKAVQAALDQACLNLTTVTIAHRLNSIQNADYIAVMDSGHVVEFGRQHDLLSRGENSVYATTIQNFKTKDILTDLIPRRIPTLSPVEQNKLHPQMVLSLTKKHQTENISVTTTEAGTNKHMKVSFVHLLNLNKPEWCQGWFGLFGATACGVIYPVPFMMTGIMASAFYSLGKHELKQTINMAVILHIGCAVSFLICNIIQHYCFGVMGAFLTERVRLRMLANILRFEVGWFDQKDNSAGALCSRLSSHAGMVRSLVGDRLSLIVQTTTAIALCFVISFVLSWRLAAVVASLQPLTAFCFYVRLKNVNGYAREAAVAQQEVSQIGNDAVCQHRTVTAYCLQDKIVEMLKSRLKTCSPKALAISQVAGIGFGVSVLVLYCSYALCLWYGGQLIAQEKITFKHFLITYILLIKTGQSVADTLILAPDVARGMAVAESVFEIMDRQTEIDAENDAGHQKCTGTITGRVEFEDVSFAYPSRADVVVLRNFSLTIEAGQTVALVGKSGSGKSTVIALLERFYDPLDGRIRIDGKDMKDFHLQSLRRQIGLVNQEPALLAMSIKDNIAYGKESATDAEITEVARVANAHTFISALPDGYSTFAGEGGAQLSGGQKQRIAIARAVLKDPAILLLDEATSALDGESERAVQEAIDKVMLGRTTIVVAHRLSTIQNVDVIGVVQDGEILEQGSHSELLSKGNQGAYYSLVHSQLDL